MAAGDFDPVKAATKIVYDKEIKDLVVGEAVLQNLTKFGSQQLSELGRSFNFPVALRSEWGLSLNGTSGNVRTLAPAQNGQLEEAVVTPFEQWFRGSLSIPAATRSTPSGQKSFVKLAALKMKMLMQQSKRVIENNILHGQEGFATVASLAGQVITLQAGSAAPAFLSILENAVIWCSDSSGTLVQKNLTVTAIDTSSSTGAYTITVSGTVTGVGTAGNLLFLQGCVSTATPAVTDEMPGLGKLISTQTGTVWGINAATYNLWRGNVQSTYGLITASKVLNSQTINTNKGGAGEYFLIVSPKQYQSLLNDEAAKQVFDSSYNPNKAEHGFDSIVMRGPAATITVISHPYQKEGKFYLVEKENIKRVGSSDHTMEPAGQELMYIIPDQNAAMYQVFTDQVMLLNAPAHNLVATGVTTL